jgi:hypothetical protein
MGLFDAFRRGGSSGAHALDEFVGDGEERAASPLDLKSKDWQKRLASFSKKASASELALSAFSLVRGGDLFERKSKPARTDPALLDTFLGEQIRFVGNKAAKEECEAATKGVLRVLAGNPALCKRMLLAKPIKLIIIPKGRDFREFEFPPHTNPHAAGIFWNSSKTEIALLGLREELIVAKPWLMVHEMTHAVHFLAFTQKEREDIDGMLLPVYRSRRWVEEAVAIYAERAFGAEYGEDELNAPGLYGKTRRDWNDQHVFALFIEELMRPDKGKKR